ncbi:MAG: acyltransferase family protein, partial [Methanomicrobiales archaeon]|nr:acyltransferase family protein [Methanomicrobiales archaeon]
FFLAGASTFFALQFRAGSEYRKERFKRLLIPFFFGLFVLIPPQSYLGLISHSNTSITYLSWYPSFFHLNFNDMDGYYLGGLTFGQLWFIFHLFIYSLVALSLFLYLNSEPGKKWINRLANAFTNPGVLFLLVPFFLVLLSQFPELAGGNPLFYIAFFVSGFILMSDSRFTDVIDTHRRTLLVLGFVPFLIGIAIIVGMGQLGVAGIGDLLMNVYADGFVSWFVVLAFMAYGRRILNITNRVLSYFTEGAYPLYILHQTVIVIVGFYVLQLAIPVIAQFGLIVLLSFLGTVLAYDLLVRRTYVTRFLFGMKAKMKAEAQV